MSKTEDILYKAHHEGIKDAVFTESKKMRNKEPNWKHSEYCDCIEEAYLRVRERNKLKK